MENFIENEFTKLWIEDGIMYGEYKQNIVIDLQAAKKIVSDRIKLCGDKSYPFFGSMSSLKNVTKEARDYFSKEDGTRYMKKLAIQTDSPIGKMMGNFFLQISKPIVPTRLFTTKEDALKWLKDEN